MKSHRPKAPDLLAIGPKIRAFPVVHGSGDFAIAVREELLSHPYDCLAVPLPPAFQDDVEAGVEALPTISAVVRRDDEGDGYSYVPIDPCQPVIAALRTAIGERIPRAFVDLETPNFEARTAVFPDPYALKKVRPESFAAGVLPAIPRPAEGRHSDRIAWMANELRELEARHERILFVCSLLDWPWVREAYRAGAPAPDPEPVYAQTAAYEADPRTLLFLLGELPFITALYERGRRELTPDDNLSVDGVKELVLSARDRLKRRLPKIAKRITPQVLALYMRYVRNLSLLERRLTPDLYTLIVAAKQTAGDEFALAVAETARLYAYAEDADPWPDPSSGPEGADSDDETEIAPDDVGDDPEDIWSASAEGSGLLRMGVDRAEIPGFGTARMTSRLPGQSLSWRTCELRPRPPEEKRKRWKQRWNPFGMCSWPPEDDRIESFQQHVRDQAKAILGADLARSEKFTTSVMDGIDIRETLRHWHTGDLYVKVIPPDRGSIEVVVFLFDVPADPKRYTSRATWYAEHSEESTLAFFSSDPMADLIGPGIAKAQYGGAMFLFPPRSIPDIWTDPRLRKLESLEEVLLGGAFMHSRERHVALVSPVPPAASWRRLARRFGRKIVHIPLKRFSGQLVERLRTFHVLNGRQVRSYAADFIRDF